MLMNGSCKEGNKNLKVYKCLMVTCLYGYLSLQIAHFKINEKPANTVYPNTGQLNLFNF